MTRAVLLITLAAAFAQAHAGVPEWAQPFVASAPEVAGVVSKHPSRVLFAETTLQVAADGQFTVRRRVVVQAQSVRAEEVGLASFSFTDGARILSSRAWYLAPDSQRARRSRDGAIDFTFDSSFLTDARVRVVPVEGVRKGSLVFFEFTATEDFPVLTYRNLFLEAGPIDVRPDDTLRLQLVSRFHGEAAIGPLAALRASQRDRRREAEAEIARVWIGATIEDWTAEVAAREAPFVETLRWTAPLNDAKLVLFPGELETLPREDVAGALRATLEVRLARLEFDAAELTELRAFWIAADRGVSVALPLRP